jgi:hypothetical protein
VAKYGSNAIGFSLGGVDITAHVLTFNGTSVESLTQDSMPFGQVWNANLPTGSKKIDDVVIGGFHDDAAGGPKALLQTLDDSPAAATQDFVITWGGGNTTTIPVYRVKYVKKGVRNQITEYESTLRKGPGAVVEA